MQKGEEEEEEEEEEGGRQHWTSEIGPETKRCLRLDKQRCRNMGCYQESAG